MAHVTSPNNLRAGKSYLWKTNATFVSNKPVLLLHSTGFATGLERALEELFYFEHYYIVKSSMKANLLSNVLNVKVLYYPLTSPVSGHSERILKPHNALWATLITKLGFRKGNNFRDLVINLLADKMVDYDNRFLKIKEKKQLNTWLTAAMFRGSLIHRKFGWMLKQSVGRPANHKFIAPRLSAAAAVRRNYNKYTKRALKIIGWKSVKPHLVNYSKKPNFWKRWRVSTSKLYDRYLSHYLSKRVGIRVCVKALNVFNYLVKKTGQLKFKTHQNHIWEKYHYHKKMFSAYYDVVHSLYLLCVIPYTERFLIKMIQYGLYNMHLQRIKPKRFFYFVDKVIKGMPLIKDTFKACRVIVTGKLRGGTARTSGYSAGFGWFPRQSLNKDIRYEFGTLSSKYGSFGIKVITWREANK